MNDVTQQRLRLLAPQLQQWKDRPRDIPPDTRMMFAMMVAACFPRFRDFAELGMRFLGFGLTEMQGDIADYMQDGSNKSMVQAQRGEAKSTLAALYAVWKLVHDQSTRVLVVSAGESQASDVALLIIRLIEHWPMLCWLRPDASRGDRTSFEAYDVHWSLRRVDKSASVSCIGITANLPGRRADLLIPDDIESPKNSMTQPMRDQLLHLSKEFTAICTHGKVLYLGTPQTKDSVYKTLPARGFDIRIWPGRYPTQEELERYPVGAVAPMILEAIQNDPSLQSGGGLDGTRGKSTDTGRYSEEDLVSKELDWGPEGFSLQFMLDTSLADAQRTKIKISDLIFFGGNHEQAPEKILYEASTRTRLTVEHPVLKSAVCYGPGSVSSKYTPYTRKIMAVDPAGKGGDEVAWAAGGTCQSYVHLFGVGGMPGGFTEENIERLFNIADQYGITEIHVEQNMGAGVVSALLLAHAVRLGRSELAFIDYPVSGQKERRIIDTISPLTRRHKFVVHTSALDSDEEACKLHPAQHRQSMSAWYQLGSITYDRGCLAHDDRADCVQRVVEVCAAGIAVDDDKASEKRQEQAALEFRKNPMGHKKSTQGREYKGTLARLNRRPYG